jgi:hypothetical protein
MDECGPARRPYQPVTEVEALRAELESLRALVASVVPPPPEPVLPVVLRTPYAYVPPATVALSTVATYPEFRHLDIRRVRQLAVAVALCRGAALPGAEVPRDFEPLMKRLAAARSKGLSWRDALAECGLEVPDDDEIGYQARALRDGLTGLWDGITGVMSTLEQRLPGWVFGDLLKKLRPYL